MWIGGLQGSETPSNSQNKCKLDGLFSWIVQIALFTLIFVAVKSRKDTQLSKTPLRATKKEHAAIFLGRTEAAPIERHDALHKSVSGRGDGRTHFERPLRLVLHHSRDGCDVRHSDIDFAALRLQPAGDLPVLEEAEVGQLLQEGTGRAGTHHGEDRLLVLCTADTLLDLHGLFGRSGSPR